MALVYSTKKEAAKIVIALLLVFVCIGVSVAGVFAAAPTNQNAVLTASKYVKDGATIRVNSTGDSSETIWLAPLGTVTFVDSSTITEANGIASIISAPATDGVYHLYVEDSIGEFSAASTHTVTADSTNPTISIGSPSVGSTSSGPVTYTVTYADTNFYTSNLSAGNITLNKTGNAQCTKSVSGSGTIKTITLSSITGNGTIGITIAANTASDLAGNHANGATSDTTNVNR